MNSSKKFWQLNVHKYILEINTSFAEKNRNQKPIHRNFCNFKKFVLDVDMGLSRMFSYNQDVKYAKFPIKIEIVRDTQKYSTNYPNKNQFNKLIRWSVFVAKMIQLSIFRFFLFVKCCFPNSGFLPPKKTQFQDKFYFHSHR